MIAPVLFGLGLDDSEAGLGVVAADVVAGLEASVVGVVGEKLVCKGLLDDGVELGEGPDVDATLEVGVVVNAEYRSVVGPRPQPM